MKDGIVNGNGDSRYLKSAIPANITFAQFVQKLRDGTLPIDFNGINAAGWEQLGTPLNKTNVLKDSTAEGLGLVVADDPTPDTAFQKLKRKHDIIAHEGKLIISTRDLESEYPENYIVLDGRTLTDAGIERYKKAFPLVGFKSAASVNTYGTYDLDNGSVGIVAEYRGALFMTNHNYGYIAYSGDHGVTWNRSLSGSAGYNPRDVVPCGNYVAVPYGINYSDGDAHFGVYIYTVSSTGAVSQYGTTGVTTGSYSGTTVGSFPETNCILVRSSSKLVLYDLANKKSTSVSDSKTYSIVRYVNGAYAGIRNDGLIYGTSPTEYTVASTAHTGLIMTTASDYTGLNANLVVVACNDGYVMYSTDKGATYTSVMVNSGNTSELRFIDKIGNYWYTFHASYSGLYRCAANASTGAPTGSWERVAVENEAVLIGETIPNTRAFKKAKILDGYYLIHMIGTSKFSFLRMDISTGKFDVLETEVTATEGAYASAYYPGTNCVAFIKDKNFVTVNILTGRARKKTLSSTLNPNTPAVNHNLARQFEDRGEIIKTVDSSGNDALFVRSSTSLNYGLFVTCNASLPTLSVDVTSDITCGTYYCFNAE